MSVLLSEWYAAQVWAGRERLSALHLQMRGYEVCLPCYHEHRRWSDRVAKVERALFTGYVFCRLTGESAAKVITTPGVTRLVGDGRRPIPIPQHEIEAIRRIADSGVTARPWEYIRTGDRVRIDKGPLQGTEGIMLRTTHGDRLIVSVAMLNRSVAVEVEAEWVSVPPVTLLSNIGYANAVDVSARGRTSGQRRLAGG